MKKLKAAVATILLVILAAPSLAASPKAYPCLTSTDAKNCLVGIALKALASEKSAEARLDGFASLLSALVKSGIRRDDAFAIAIDDASAPLISRWSLAVARKTYAFQFSIANAQVDDLDRIEAMGEYLRSRQDGLERLAVASTSCETRENLPALTVSKWGGVLDRLCRIDPSDAEVLEKEIPGLSAIAPPLFDAYNRNEKALRQSLPASLNILSGYETLLAESKSATERSAMRGILAVGHLFNASALVTSGYQEGAVKELEISLSHLRKSPAIAQAPEFKLFFAQASWIYAKAGIRDKAMNSVRESIRNVDQKKVGSCGHEASAIATAIETLRILDVAH